MRKKIQIIVIIGTAFCGLMFFLLYNGYIGFNYPSKKKFPIQGIDISHHQGDIKWKKLQTENISFIFIKATEGADSKDPKFNENWENARAHGYPVGAYHFYRLCKTGSEQADNFIASVPKEQGTLPPVVDLEFGGNCQTQKTRDQVLQEIQDYIDKIKKYYGQAPIIYVTTDFYDIYLIDRFKECSIWIRDIYSEPKLPDNKKWVFWQYANRGHLNGIDGYVDINVFNGDSIEFRKIIK